MSYSPLPSYSDTPDLDNHTPPSNTNYGQNAFLYSEARRVSVITYDKSIHHVDDCLSLQRFLGSRGSEGHKMNTGSPGTMYNINLSSELEMRLQMLQDQLRALKENPSSDVQPTVRRNTSFGNLLGMSEPARQHAPTDVCWVDIQAPTDEDFEHLADIFQIHPLTIEDCMSHHEHHEKWEVFDNYIYIVVSGFRISDADVQHLEYLNILLFEDVIISAHSSAMKSISKLFNRLVLSKGSGTGRKSGIYENRVASTIRPRSHFNRTFETLVSPKTFNPNWILHALLDINTDLFFSSVTAVDQETEVLNNLALILGESEQKDLLLRIGNARKRIAVLFRILQPKRSIFEALTTRTLPFVSQDLKVFMRDALDHVNLMLEELTFAKEMLISSHSNYLAQISIELSASSNEMNVLVKKLSSLGALILPLSLISGIWGMNCKVPGQFAPGEGDNYMWFAGLVCTMLFLLVVSSIFFWKFNLF